MVGASSNRQQLLWPAVRCKVGLDTHTQTHTDVLSLSLSRVCSDFLLADREAGRLPRYRSQCMWRIDWRLGLQVAFRRLRRTGDMNKLSPIPLLKYPMNLAEQSLFERESVAIPPFFSFYVLLCRRIVSLWCISVSKHTRGRNMIDVWFLESAKLMR